MNRARKKGEVWKIDSRGGPLTIQLLENVDLKKKDTGLDGNWFKARVVEGTVRSSSFEFNLYQKPEGFGMVGTVHEFRASLVQWKKRLH